MNWFRKGVLVCLLSVLLAVKQLPDNKLHLIFCDVGQGDASLITKGNFQMLVDTGPKKGGVVDCLGRHIPFWDKKIEVVLISHPQADHMGDLGQVEEHYQIEKKLLTSTNGDRIRYGNLSFDILWPTKEVREDVLGASTDLNQLSTVARLNYGQFRALFTGDLGEVGERALVDEGVLSRITVLKVAHHGSKYSSSEEFLDATKPKWAVISVGAKNSYGHPTSEALGRLRMVGARLLRTDRDGEIEFVSDGKKVGVVE